MRLMHRTPFKQAAVLCPRLTAAIGCNELKVRTARPNLANACMKNSCRNLRVAALMSLAVLIEELVGLTDIGFGMLHGRRGQKHERCLR